VAPTEIGRWRDDYNSTRPHRASDNKRPRGSRGHSKTTLSCLEKWHNFGVPVMRCLLSVERDAAYGAILTVIPYPYPGVRAFFTRTPPDG
jgi:hypothetical protein